MPEQKFVRCTGKSVYGTIRDEFSPDDDPRGLLLTRTLGTQRNLTVELFVRIY